MSRGPRESFSLPETAPANPPRVGKNIDQGISLSLPPFRCLAEALGCRQCATESRLPLYHETSAALSVSGWTLMRTRIPLKSPNQSFVALPCFHTAFIFGSFSSFASAGGVSLTLYNVQNLLWWR